MKAKLITYTFLLLLIGTGCMKISKKGAEKTTSPANGNEPTEIFVPEEPPNQTSTSALHKSQDFYELKKDRFDYVVTSEKIDFHFPETWPTDIFVEFTINQNKMVIPIKNERYWSFKWPAQDQKIQFRFFSSADFSIKPLKSIHVLPELSLEISDLYNLAGQWSFINELEKIYFNDLTLNRNSKLLLGTFSGQIFIRNLRSADGTIQSFETSSKAALDQNGRSGGFVEIFAKSGEGSLNLQAIGEHGGDGSPGRDPDLEIKGIGGADGVRSTFTVDVHYCGMNPNCMAIPSVNCATPPGPGSDGKEGKRGYSGLPGKDGGNSGRYYLAFGIEGLNVVELTRAGAGGIGGPGGLGGEGGTGGDGGSGEWLDFLIGNRKMKKEDAIRELNKVPRVVVMGLVSKKCEAAAKGKDGARGPDGYNGAPGAPGADQGKKN